MLIYVFDIESESPEEDFDHFARVLTAIQENSPDARIFVLVHKMDLVHEEERDAIFLERHELINETCEACQIQYYRSFATSIWDETLYKAWSEIVTNLIPNIAILEKHLQNFCQVCQADEVVLFERATFLVISQTHVGPPCNDPHRFEKISNIVKQFKLSCGKAQSQFQALQVRNSKFQAYLDAFTGNTYIMVIVSNPTVHSAATLLNIQNARNHFEKFIPTIWSKQHKKER